MFDKIVPMTCEGASLIFDGFVGSNAKLGRQERGMCISDAGAWLNLCVASDSGMYAGSSEHSILCLDSGIFAGSSPTFEGSTSDAPIYSHVDVQTATIPKISKPLESPFTKCIKFGFAYPAYFFHRTYGHWSEHGARRFGRILPPTFLSLVQNVNYHVARS